MLPLSREMHPMSARKSVSLSNELHVLMDSMGGLHSLTRQWIDSFGQEAHIPDQIYALLTLLMDRLRLLDRAVRGTVDPHLAWSKQNDADLIPGDPREEDVILTCWSNRRLLRHHRAELRSARQRIALLRKRRKEEPSGS